MKISLKSSHVIFLRYLGCIKVCFLVGLQTGFGQCNQLPPATAFTINGNASALGNNEFRLTENMPSKSGSLWYSNYLDLNQDFALEFDVFLGISDRGADGMAFVLQQSPQGKAAQSLGGGLGYKDISPSLDIEYDTWSNRDYNDPLSDHIAITKNGNVVHNTDQISDPVWISNMEDGKYHRTKIVWNASSQVLKVFWDSDIIPSIEKTINLKATIFANNPFVYWGWTGSTGMEKNLQKVKLVKVKFAQQLSTIGNIVPSTCSGPTGAIDLSVIGGIAPFTFQWSNGSTKEDIFALLPGEYTVSVTDACGNVGSSLFRINSLSTAAVIVCPGNSVLDNTPGKCGTDNVLYTYPYLKEGCGSSALIKQTEGLPSGSMFPMGSTSNTFRIVNADGTSTSCTFQVTVR